MIKLNGKQARVCIDPGHGGHDSGAVGPSGIRECDMALQISKELMFQLEELGIDSYLTRTEDEYITLGNRVEESEDSDCMVSVHCNAHSSQANGIETLYSKSAGKHKALANYVQQSLIKYCKGHKDRGIRMSPGPKIPRKLFILAAAKVPTCLTEVEFLSNTEQEKWIKDEEGQKQIAHAIANGIKSFLMSLSGAIKSDDREVERHQESEAVAPMSTEKKVGQEDSLTESGVAALLDNTVDMIKEPKRMCMPDDESEEFESVGITEAAEKLDQPKPEKKRGWGWTRKTK